MTSVVIVIPWTLLGIVTGGLGAAAVVFGAGRGGALWVAAPGPIFAAAFGLALWHERLFGPIAALLYAIAAALSYGAALAAGFYLFLVLAAPPAFLSEAGSMALSGVLAGALGGGLLAAVTHLLAPIRFWSSLLLVGALLGASLPLAMDGVLRLVLEGGSISRHRQAGIFIFYMLWQGGYAACLVWTLRRDREDSRRLK